MKDGRVKAISTIRSRLVRARTNLCATLAEQQDERDKADAQVAEQEVMVARAAREVEDRAARIDALLDGRQAVRIEELLHWETLLAEARTQRTRELDTLQHMRDRVTEIDQKIAATRAAIVQHDVRIDLCGARLDRIRRAAEAQADDTQDEESEEAFVARRLAHSRAQRRRATTEAAR